MAIAFHVSAGDASHVSVNVALYIAANLDVAVIGLYSLGIASNLDAVAIVHFKAFYVAFDIDVDNFFVGVNGFQNVNRLAVNEYLAVCYCHSAAILDDGARVVFVYYDCHIGDC